LKRTATRSEQEVVEDSTLTIMLPDVPDEIVSPVVALNDLGHVRPRMNSSGNSTVPIGVAFRRDHEDIRPLRCIRSGACQWYQQYRKTPTKRKKRNLPRLSRKSIHLTHSMEKNLGR